MLSRFFPRLIHGIISGIRPPFHRQRADVDAPLVASGQAVATCSPVLLPKRLSDVSICGVTAPSMFVHMASRSPYLPRR